jgi:hypothetical protein
MIITMIKQWQKKRNIGVLGGLIISWAGVGLFFLSPHTDLIYLAGLMVLIGIGFWFWGFAAYAVAKGYPAILGICLALLLNVLGLVVLLALPDKHKFA